MSRDQSEPAAAAATARKLFDRLLRNAGVLVDDVVASKAFSATMARGLGAVAGATSLVRDSTQQVGEFAADWLNVPTRRQLIEMAARLNRVEVMLDDIDFRTGELLDRSEPETDDD